MNSSNQPVPLPILNTSQEFQSGAVGNHDRGLRSEESGQSHNKTVPSSAAHIRSEVLEMTEGLIGSLGELRDDISKSILQSLVQRSYKLLRYVIALNGLDPTEAHKQAEQFAESSASILIDLKPGQELSPGFDKALANYKEILQILSRE